MAQVEIVEGTPLFGGFLKSLCRRGGRGMGREGVRGLECQEPGALLRESSSIWHGLRMGAIVFFLTGVETIPERIPSSCMSPLPGAR